MDYLTFSNAGIADPAALRLMGASTKRDDTSKIGYFGSGFKYALALTIRELIKAKCSDPVRLFLGKEEQVISYRLEGQWREIIIDGRSTGLTTDLGPSWEPWMALREFYCNAVDGGDHRITAVSGALGAPEAGRTVLAIPMIPCLEKAWRERSAWMLDPSQSGAVLHEEIPGHGRLYTAASGNGGRIYRKGILVQSDPSSLPFNVDLDFAAISEDRRLEEPRMTAIWPLLSAATTSTKLAVIASHTSLPWSPSKEGWKLPGLFVTSEEVEFHSPPPPYVIVREAWRDFLASAGCETYRHRPWIRPRKAELLKEETKALTEAIALINKTGLNLSRLEIVVAENLRNNELGVFESDSKVIYINRRLFRLGRRQLVATLIHEVAHRDSGESDCTHGFEDHLTNLLADFTAKIGRVVL